MNFAFSALAILLLALPGIIFYWVYIAERGRPVGTGVIDDTPKGVVFSVLLHAVGVAFANQIGKMFQEPVHVDLAAAIAIVAAPAAKDGGLAPAVAHAITDGYYPIY